LRSGQAFAEAADPGAGLGEELVGRGVGDPEVRAASSALEIGARPGMAVTEGGARDGDARLRRVRIRSWRRGTREMDLILGGFADAELAWLEPEALADLERLLEEGDHDLYRWVASPGAAPESYRAIIERIQRHHRIR
jgi:antitoxin CptB